MEYLGRGYLDKIIDFLKTSEADIIGFQEAIQNKMETLGDCLELKEVRNWKL